MKWSFGKYRNQETSVVINDKSYCEFLKNQPWFPKKYPKEYNDLINYKPPFNFFECLENNLDSDCLGMVSRYLHPQWNDYYKRVPKTLNNGLVKYDRVEVNQNIEEIYAQEQLDEEDDRIDTIGSTSMSFNSRPMECHKHRIMCAFKHRYNIMKVITKNYNIKSYKDPYFKIYWDYKLRMNLLKYVLNNNGCTQGERQAEFAVRKWWAGKLDDFMEKLGREKLDFGKYRNEEYYKVFQLGKKHWDRYGETGYIKYLKNECGDKYKNDILEKKPMLKLYIEMCDTKSCWERTSRNLYN